MGERRDRTKAGGTIRGRIAAGMFLAALLVLPAVIVALVYLGRMNAVVQQIVDSDLELVRLGDRITLTFVQARRNEKNFLLYRDSAYLAGSRASLAQVALLCGRGVRLAPDFAPLFRAIVSDAVVYQAQLDTLIARSRTEFSDAALRDFARLRTQHQLLLDMVDVSEDSTVRDSLLRAADELIARMSGPTDGLLGRLLNERILRIEERIRARTDSVVQHAVERTRENQRRARQLSAWGQRNIVTVLLLVVISLVWLVVTLPNRLVIPVKRIANAFVRAEQGDLDVHIPLTTNDELGRLARQLNRVFARLREFDELKTQRIFALERRFRLLANDIAEGVMVIDRTPRVVFVNAAAASLLGRPPDEATGHALAEFPSLGPLRETIEHTLAGATGHRECELVPSLPGAVVCIEALRDKSGNVVGALLVITGPVAPEPTEAEPEEGD